MRTFNENCNAFNLWLKTGEYRNLKVVGAMTCVYVPAIAGTLLLGPGILVIYVGCSVLITFAFSPSDEDIEKINKLAEEINAKVDMDTAIRNIPTLKDTKKQVKITAITNPKDVATDDNKKWSNIMSKWFAKAPANDNIVKNNEPPALVVATFIGDNIHEGTHKGDYGEMVLIAEVVY